jgi:hypothetical protein
MGLLNKNMSTAFTETAELTKNDKKKKAIIK